MCIGCVIKYKLFLFLFMYIIKNKKRNKIKELNKKDKK